MNKRYDVLVIGSGSAGLSLALHLPKGSNVAVLSKTTLSAGSSYYAQGGVAAVLSGDKAALQSHINDTLKAGLGLCDEHAVEYTVVHAKECIEWLITRGVVFTQETQQDGSQRYHLTREGGHSERRILHADDATGKAISTTLESLASKEDNIKLYESHAAVDLIKQEGRIVGAYVLNIKTGQVETFLAKAVVLATGGASRVYYYTSNPEVASGDGIAMAWRVGCTITNMEFNQFHPTSLYHPKLPCFVLSEVMRGEGGYLRLPDGERFLQRYDDALELASRDIVSRAIDAEMKRLGIDHVYLDMTHKAPDFIRQRFPMIERKCSKLGLDITREWIPVVPAAHYTCGGVETDLNGFTQLPGLYAVGEVAYTGLHGANRMASNSLLECQVFARSAARAIAAHDLQQAEPEQVKAWDESRVTDSPEAVIIKHSWNELRRLMWDYVGLVRSNERLAKAKKHVALIKQDIDEYYAHFKVTRDLVELRNLVVVAELIIRSAALRHESRGLHYTVDYPEKLTTSQATRLRQV